MCVLAPKLCLEISKGKEINRKLTINWPVIKDTDLLHVLINSVLISFHLKSTFTMFYDPKKIQLPSYSVLYGSNFDLNGSEAFL